MAPPYFVFGEVSRYGLAGAGVAVRAVAALISSAVLGKLKVPPCVIDYVILADIWAGL